MKYRLLTVAFITTLAVALFIVPAKGTPTLPLNMNLTRSGVWLQNATESSWVNFGGTQYYIYTDRSLSGGGAQMKLVKFSDNSAVATFGVGYGCQDAIVSGSTLYVFATGCYQDASHAGNSIVMYSTTNLTTWSGPTTIYTPESSSQIYNVGIGSDGAGNFLMSFDVHNPYWYSTYFVTRFLTSTNLTSWSAVSASNVLASDGAAQPEYHAGSWYFFVNTESGAPYEEVLFKANSTLSSFTQSRLPLLKPTTEYEDINTTDVSLGTFGGTTYIMYMVGDQSTYARMTYATYNGTIDQLIDAYWQ